MKPGSKWRILAWANPGDDDEERIALSSEDRPSIFDELVVSPWLHLEQMGKREWWMEVAGVTVLVRTARNGNPERVTVYGPGDYAEAVDGVSYFGAVGPTP